MSMENFIVDTVEFFFFNKNVFFQLVLTTNAKKKMNLYLNFNLKLMSKLFCVSIYVIKLSNINWVCPSLINIKILKSLYN